MVVKVFNAHLSCRVWLILGNHRVEIAAAVSSACGVSSRADLSSIDVDNILKGGRGSRNLGDFDGIGVPVAVSAAWIKNCTMIRFVRIIHADRQLSVSWDVVNRKLSMTRSSIMFGDCIVRQMNNIPVSGVTGDVLAENIDGNLLIGL